ncbi:putative serine/threonine protein kinase [Aspergillus clavatus NRRL 1]|uniref:non-specific serine/threonine protein kinase n=1 Tax=Aspergillus clavatus (strain ATCC 1007 / CBS 513.65 / DSM 816 / NCTC 3887 / NRRL 1 / QM 1276 / 107) TaxID=344612 RepID=A1C7J0_ASPCL|nr:serine/threonine protein kinase, putative [Aspergillus clavatus NRRL 1]EAW14361.1 serine/threonin protein kinase, putative [Aspergillus clavatus NRRL 1]
MDNPRASGLLDPTSALAAAIGKHKAEAIKLAREQGAAVREMCRRAKTESPPYEFEELIGKGSYGRVYKGHQLPSGRVVAIKVMDIDSMDYRSVRDFKDESIKDFIHETKVMKQVKDAGAKNINELIEAISIHSQLWLVCEYCPGGSVRTLMRATGDKLDERFIIPIARELAAGLRAIHDAGIIHRDIKAANILIHEEGRLQICDFGVAGVLQSHMDKRSTWIGTPHWMPPEMFMARGEAHQYGSEIDVWAYGCTLFEFATGNPPNSNLRERMQIGRQLNRTTPRLANEEYSEDLKDLVSFALESEPISRPTMTDILSHPYIAGTEEEYPISSLSELVRIYYQWSQRGGQRISLFHPGGAAAAEFPEHEQDFEEDWNFSTTDGFERRFSVIDLDQIAASLAQLEEQMSPTTVDHSDRDPFEDPTDPEMTVEDKANFDERVRRGAAAMEGLFNEDMPSYKYETKNDFVPIEPKPPVSDLPLRTETDRSSVTSTFIDIDIGSFDSSHYAAGAVSAQPFQLADADTIKANRSSGRQGRSSIGSRSRSSSSDVGTNQESQQLTYQPQSGPRPPTMDWKFPVFMQAPEEESEIVESIETTVTETHQAIESTETVETTPTATSSAPKDKRATMDWTFPDMSAAMDEQGGPSDSEEPSRHDTLRAPLVGLQPSATIRPLSIGEPGDSRPSTSASAHSILSNHSDTDYDPFRFDRPPTPPGKLAAAAFFFFFFFTILTFLRLLESAGYGDFERPSPLDGPGPDEEDTRSTVWDHNTEIITPSHSEPFPTAIPTREMEHSQPFPTLNDYPIIEPLPTARRDPRPAVRDDLEPINFPDLVPPRLEALTAGADDSAVTAELDRLLGDFLDALTATGDALSRASVDPETTRRPSVPDQAE